MPSLTEIELLAYADGVVNLSDGHARQSLGETSRRNLVAAFGDLVTSGGSNYPQAVEEFWDKLAAHTGQRYGATSTHVVYAASIALDVVGRYLSPQRGAIGMVTPIFDNIPTLFRRSSLTLTAVPERHVMPECDVDFLDSLRLDALVLVTPNNPTGTRLHFTEIVRLLEWAARRNVTLVLDLAFRLFDSDLRRDVIAAANEVGSDLVTVDDTGKILPLYGTRVGVLSATRRLGACLGRLCADVQLDVSELDLRMLCVLLEGKGDGSEVTAARRLAAANRRALERRLPPWVRMSGVGDEDFRPSVAWLRCGAVRDAVVAACRKRSLEILPGDQFFWDSATGRNEGSEWIRVSLMRDADYFARGTELLAEAIHDVAAEGVVEGRSW